MTACGPDKNDEKRPTDSGVCDGLQAPIDKLNDALLEDGGPKSIVAGDEVITGYDAGCMSKNGQMD